jgi:hypothetical protein
MRTRSSALIVLTILAGLFGCNRMHARPANVPSTAVWVDNTFVDCSVEKNLGENRCTVYKDRTGEILADGFFVLSSSHAAADKSNLHYVAFGDRGIFLENADILVHRVPSLRDPSNKIIDSRLRNLVFKGSAEPVNCGSIEPVGSTDARANCAIKAFAERTPFYVRYYAQFPNSFGYKGYAGDSDGNLYRINYYSGHEFEYGDRLGTRDDSEHMSFGECPKPAGLGKMKDGTLFCLFPVAKHPFITRSTPD